MDREKFFKLLQTMQMLSLKQTRISGTFICPLNLAAEDEISDSVRGIVRTLCKVLLSLG